jgi:hypothetical protein
MKFSKFVGFGVVLLLLASGALVAQDIPLNNWTVPPYTQSSHSGGITTMSDSTPPRLFVGITPCRVADTRGNGAPIQGGIFANSEARNWDVTGICGIPAGADAISVNFTVVSAPATPQGAFMLAWPTGSPPSPIVALMTYGPGVTILSNSAIVPLAAGELLTVNVSHSTHIIMDVNGYFSDTLQSPGNFLTLTNNSAIWTADFANLSTSCTGTCGVLATVSGGNAIVGVSTDTAGSNLGVSGSVASTGTNSAGVRGFANGLTGRTYGVYGRSFSPNTEAAGVKGLSASGDLSPTSNCCGDLGVLGVSKDGYATVGVSNSTAGLFLRYAAGTTNVLSFSWIATDFGNDYAFYASTGDYGGTGAKYFVEPHPTDPNKIIRYVSLEGPESGTYFRGRGKFLNGLARISVPESFRIVTDEAGLSIQVTPIGQMATVAVESIDLNEIVVRGSRNVEFFYTVNGVRRAFKDFEAISDAKNGGEFMPLNPEWKMPEYPAELKRRLIQNGTYKVDGTVNMETAKTLGWDRIWEAKSRPQPQPVADTP